MIYSLQIALSLVLDFIFGDPRWYPHPIRGVGWLIERSEYLFRRSFKNERVAGVCTVCTVISITVLVVAIPLVIAAAISSVFEGLLAILFLYMAVSTKDLLVHSNDVFNSLTGGDAIEESRKKIGMIVGRDTTQLTEEEISKACVETVAENMVDGTTAPLFYAVLGSFLAPFVPLSPIGCSAVLVFGYKAVNTMDSMIGYKNDKYLNFGRAAAQLDDLVNYIPARLSGRILVAAAFLLGLDWKKSRKIYLRDKANHSSPNAAHPEAAVAGALHLRLGGPSVYFGKIVEKPWIGDGVEVPDPRHIKATNRLVVVGIMLFITILLLLRFWFSQIVS